MKGVQWILHLVRKVSSPHRDEVSVPFRSVSGRSWGAFGGIVMFEYAGIMREPKDAPGPVNRLHFL